MCSSYAVNLNAFLVLEIEKGYTNTHWMIAFRTGILQQKQIIILTIITMTYQEVKQCSLWTSFSWQTHVERGEIEGFSSDEDNNGFESNLEDAPR